MKNTTLLCMALILLTGCSTIGMPTSGDTLSKMQMNIEWKRASPPCKQLYRRYKRSVSAVSLDNFEYWVEANRKAQATAEKHNCSQKYLLTLADEGF